MVVKTEGKSESDIVVFEEDKRYSRKTVTVVSGEGVLNPGAVLGEVTASGKFAHSPNAQVVGKEGAETATVVLLEKVDATSADAEAVALKAHAIVNRSNLEFEATVDDATKRQTKVDQLDAVGIESRQGA